MTVVRGSSSHREQPWCRLHPLLVIDTSEWSELHIFGVTLLGMQFTLLSVVFLGWNMNILLKVTCFKKVDWKLLCQRYLRYATVVLYIHGCGYFYSSRASSWCSEKDCMRSKCKYVQCESKKITPLRPAVFWHFSQTVVNFKSVFTGLPVF